MFVVYICYLFLLVCYPNSRTESTDGILERNEQNPRVESFGTNLRKEFSMGNDKIPRQCSRHSYDSALDFGSNL